VGKLQTFRSRKEELTIGQWIARKYGLRYVAFDSNSFSDGVLTQPNQTPYRICEIKGRNKTYDEHFAKYSDIMIEQYKISQGLSRADITGVPFTVFVHFGCGTVVALKVVGVRNDWPIDVLHRTDRRLPNDHDSCYQIPKDQWTIIGNWKE